VPSVVIGILQKSNDIHLVQISFTDIGWWIFSEKLVATWTKPRNRVQMEK
jgi:hypothetical protein